MMGGWVFQKRTDSESSRTTKRNLACAICANERSITSTKSLCHALIKMGVAEALQPKETLL
jgi:hypothetical protein